MEKNVVTDRMLKRTLQTLEKRVQQEVDLEDDRDM